MILLNIITKQLLYLIKLLEDFNDVKIGNTSDYIENENNFL